MNKVSICKRCLLSLILIAMSCMAEAQELGTLSHPHLHTVLTYNIRNAQTEDNHIDLDDVAATIMESGADFVALQELDSMTVRSGNRYLVGELAIRTGLFPTYGAAIPYDGGKYGVGILSRRRPISVRNIPLPGREEARTLLIAEFPDIVFACTHLSLTRKDRQASLAILQAEAARYHKPFILTGDLNDTPESDFIQKLKEHFSIEPSGNSPTFPATKPRKHIDFIAPYKSTGQSLLWKDSWVMKHSKTSDHLPLVSRFYIRTPLENILYGKPYLQNPTPEAMTVMYQTNTRVHSWIEYGMDTLNLHKVEQLQGGQAMCHNMNHKVRIAGLQDGTKYYYRICAREIFHYGAYNKIIGDTLRTQFYSFTTPAHNEKDFTALILNDLHQVSTTISAMAQLAKGIPHDFVIFNGDCLTEPSTMTEAMEMVHRLTSQFSSAEIPAFFVRGNHEIRNAYSAGLPWLMDQPGGETYGAFSWGDTRFVILDCGEDKPDEHWVYYGMNDFSKFREEQKEFLQQEINGQKFKQASRRILLHHIPLWGNTDKYQPCTDLWTPLCTEGTFDVDIAAHTHEFHYHPPHTVNNPFPVFIGGGPSCSEATMMILSKRGNKLSLRVINAEGKELGDWIL